MMGRWEPAIVVRTLQFILHTHYGMQRWISELITGLVGIQGGGEEQQVI